jgi:hypothetical protein
VLCAGGFSDVPFDGDSLPCGSLAAQEIDAIITSENRKAATIADEIHDPAARSLSRTLCKR